MLTIITGCDIKYAPGVKALKHSIERNVPEGEIDFWCLAYGEQSLIDDLEAAGIQVIANPPFPANTVFPVAGRWAPNVVAHYPNGMGGMQYGMPAMYCRLLIPSLFPHLDRALWVDADCLVMQSIKELETFNFHDHAMASTDISDEVNGNFGSLKERHGQGNNLGHRACGTGTMLINIPAWTQREISEKCFEIQNNCDAKSEMLAVVQSVLILALKGDFATYGWKYMYNIKRYPLTPDVRIMHFPIMLPWCDFDLSHKPRHLVECAKKYWEPYR